VLYGAQSLAVADARIRGSQQRIECAEQSPVKTFGGAQKNTIVIDVIRAITAVATGTADGRSSMQGQQSVIDLCQRVVTHSEKTLSIDALQLAVDRAMLALAFAHAKQIA